MKYERVINSEFTGHCYSMRTILIVGALGLLASCGDNGRRAAGVGDARNGVDPVPDAVADARADAAGRDAAGRDAAMRDAAMPDAAMPDAPPPVVARLAVNISGTTWGEIWYSSNGFNPTRCAVVNGVCTIGFTTTNWSAELYALTLSKFDGWGAQACTGNTCIVQGSGDFALPVSFSTLPGEIATVAITSNESAPMLAMDPSIMWLPGDSNDNGLLADNHIAQGDTFAIGGGSSATFATLGDPEVGEPVWTIALRNSGGVSIGETLVRGRYRHGTAITSDGCVCMSSSGQGRVEVACGALTPGAVIRSATPVLTQSVASVNSMVSAYACNKTAWAYEPKFDNVNGLAFADRMWLPEQFAQRDIGPVGMVAVGAGATLRGVVVDMGLASDRTRVVQLRQY